MYSRRNEAKEERQRQKLDAGVMSDRFPAVSGIIVTMTYRKNGEESLLRTLNYYPASHAFFKMSCLGEGCTDGGLDLTNAITSLIGSHRKSGKGKLTCTGSDPSAVHADISYEVAVSYR